MSPPARRVSPFIFAPVKRYFLPLSLRMNGLSRLSAAVGTTYVVEIVAFFRLDYVGVMSHSGVPKSAVSLGYNRAIVFEGL